MLGFKGFRIGLRGLGLCFVFCASFFWFVFFSFLFLFPCFVMIGQSLGFKVESLRWRVQERVLVVIPGSGFGVDLAGLVVVFAPLFVCQHLRGLGALSSLIGPVDPSFQALSGRLKFTVRRHKFHKDSLSQHLRGLGVGVWGTLPIQPVAV